MDYGIISTREIVLCQQTNAVHIVSCFIFLYVYIYIYIYAHIQMHFMNTVSLVKNIFIYKQVRLLYRK